MVCWCKTILSALIIIFMFLTGTWVKWAVIVAAAIILIISLTGFCCCGSGTCGPKKK